MSYTATVQIPWVSELQNSMTNFSNRGLGWAQWGFGFIWAIPTPLRIVFPFPQKCVTNK